ncbi:hypothetical protein [Nitrosomonas marina]|uniref:Concanavalin A-like lectin/glucanases superfamily protein n=1 Tax=Nitrosomonas marina TaxID=917 RepID=A0A1H8GI25_9PROT|nr:hypothetical protein [Nitrosomonas marina]SEN43404.1 hypothetical protein SAMN05216325_11825 [Nitrosomonas marina]
MSDLLIPDSRLEIPQILFPRRKPVGVSVAVDRAHWFSKYLDHAYLPDNSDLLRDMFGNNDLVTSGCTFKNGKLITSGSGHAGSLSYAPMDRGFLLLDMAWQETYDTGPHDIFSSFVSGGNVRIYYNQFGPPYQFEMLTRGGFGATDTLNVGSDDPSSSDIADKITYLFTWDFSGDVAIYMNGRQIASITSTTTADSQTATSNLLENVQSHVYAIYAGGRSVPPAAAKAITADPYQIFIPAHKSKASLIYFGATGGASTVTIGLATESDSAFAASRLKSRQIAQPSESDTGFAASSLKSSEIGQASESDSAFSIGRAKLRSILQSTEADTAFAVTSSGGVFIGQASETDSAFSAASAKLRSIVQAIESDTGSLFTWVKLRYIGLSNETDSAFAMSTVGNVPIGLALEANTAQIVDILKTLGIGLGSETDSGFTVTSLKSRQIGLSLESDAAFDVSVSKQRTISQSSEADTAFPFSSDGSITVLIGLATEADSALAAARNKTRVISIGNETDAAFDMDALFSGAIGHASETDSAFLIDRSKATSIGLATETDTALIFTSDSVITVRAPSGTGYSPGRVISVRPAQTYPKRIH